MDERKRNILIIAATTAAVVLMVVANIAFILMHPSGTENRNKLAASDVKAETSTSTPAARHQKPLEVCEKLAPKAAATYTSKAADRDRLIKRYFASDAQGLNIPIDRIADQPDVQASGGMNAGTSTTATCSVWTGLESPWTLTWRWTGRQGLEMHRHQRAARRRVHRPRRQGAGGRQGRREMIRTDRKTGEPILSPKLTADHLHAMANDPGWRPWMRLIAEHPHAWPALIDWWHNAQTQGFDAAGAAPKPPESMRRRRRVAIPSAPLPPEDEPEQEPEPASMDEEPSRSQSSVSGSSHEPETEQSHPDDSAEKAPKDADGDFAALEQVADPEPTAMSLPPISEPEPTETGKTERPGGLSAAVTYSADLDDLKVRRVFPVGKALVAIVMAASLIAVSWIGPANQNPPRRRRAARGA